MNKDLVDEILATSVDSKDVNDEKVCPAKSLRLEII